MCSFYRPVCTKNVSDVVIPSKTPDQEGCLSEARKRFSVDGTGVLTVPVLVLCAHGKHTVRIRG